jgi:hypothetical protein
MSEGKTDKTSQMQSAVNNVQVTMQNQSFTIEVLKEELADCRENLLGHKVSLRNSKVLVKNLQLANDQKLEHIKDSESALATAKSHAASLEDKANALIWHLEAITDKEIDDTYIDEILDMWKSNQEAKSRRAKQLAVADAVKEQQGRDIEIPHEPAIDEPIVTEVPTQNEGVKGNTGNIGVAGTNEDTGTEPVAPARQPQRVKQRKK